MQLRETRSKSSLYPGNAELKGVGARGTIGNALTFTAPVTMQIRFEQRKMQINADFFSKISLRND